MRTILVCSVIVMLSMASPQGASEGTGPSAAESLSRLREGNERFASDPTTPLPVDEARRTALVSGQAPFAAILSCADSRVPPEIVFNTGIGDLFVVRAAGEVVDKSVLASIEYGAEHLHVPLIVVMGHESCGAVKTATDVGPASKKSLGPNLDYLVKAIQPAVARSSRSLFEEPLKAAILANVEQSIADMQAQSAILRHLVETGKVQMIGAYYHLGSGHVVFSQMVKTGRPKAPAVAAPTAAAHSPMHK